MQLKEKVDIQHTAVLAVDVQKDFCSPDGALAKRGRDMSMINEVMNKLPDFLKKCSDLGVTTLYTQQIYERNKLNKLQIEQYDLDGKYVTCDIETVGHDFYQVNPDKDSIFVKYNYDAFSNTNLELTLQELGVKTLVIIGFDTFYCVETAIRRAFDAGYKVVVPQDLVGCSAKHMAMHKRTLELVDKTYGVTCTSDDLLRTWSKSIAK